MKKKQLKAFKHFGFWKCMDTKRDRDELDQLSKKEKVFSKRNWEYKSLRI